MACRGRLTEAGQVWACEVMKRNRSIIFGKPSEAQRSAWEAKPGGVALLQDQEWSCRKHR